MRQPSHPEDTPAISSSADRLSGPGRLVAAAVAAHRAGRLDEAEPLYRQALTLDPRHAEALHYFGVLHHQRGSHAAAAALLEHALVIDPTDAACWSNRGLVAAALGNHHEATRFYRNALQLQPDFADAHNNLGVALQAQNAFDEAIQAYHDALALDPSLADAYLNLGSVLARLERHDEALACYERALALAPFSADAYFNAGNAQMAKGDSAAAIACFRRAAELRPAFANAHINLGSAMCRLGHYADAEQQYRQAVALKPNAANLVCLGASLGAQGRLDEEEVFYRGALELDPDYAHAHTSLGVLARNLGAWDDAERHLRRAIALMPDNFPARAHLGMVLLAAGRYEEAWPYFDDRQVHLTHADSRHNSIRPQLPLPQWKGEPPDTAKRDNATAPRSARLLVIHEQGLGDSLQFARYLPLALTRFAQVGYICPRPLRRLYEESFCSRWPGLVLLDPLRPELDNWDWYCPLMSLPMAFGTRLDNIPAPATYLHADSARAAAWQARLAQLPNPGLPRVGVVWAGGHSGMAEDKVRSMTSAQMAPLLALSHIRWISLQKTDDVSKRADTASQARLTDWTDEIADFADTAALIENLDLVISVDTSTAHLAAAMGKPVWLLNRFAGCWRWLRDRNDSPWYPTIRIFSQAQRGNWDEVLVRVAAALQHEFPREFVHDGGRHAR
ncbi:tetratricopeptide repeat protein [Paraburkholderia fungorum]|uniref:tetratricopeptide repeat protein n=1 Tax=Paraburkholderia fungorum TaxID=134537 RepID=UPI00068CDFCE